MGEDVSPDIFNERHLKALQEVENSLQEYNSFELVGRGDAFPLLKTNSVIWRTTFRALEKDWVVDIGLPKRFPDEPPIACVSDWKELFLKNPHVLKGGVLCTIPSSSALNSSDPVGLFKYVCEKSKEILEGTNINDFREEFSYYWNRCVTEDARDVLIIDPIEKLGKTFPVIFCKGYICVATSLEKLNTWISNRVGKDSELEEERLGIALNLKAPLLPSDYPQTISDLISLAEANDNSAAKVIINNVLLNSLYGFVLLVQKEGEGVALGGIVFKGVYSSKLSHGFRKGNVPINVLRSRASLLIRSTNLVISKIVRVDHSWVHSRGGDGRDLSKKKVLLIGCGSLGGYVAHLLSRAGLGKLTITDNDMLGWENLGRHILGASSLGRWKADALAQELTRDLPHLEIIGIAKDWRDIFDSDKEIFKKHDLVISTVADWRCERPLNNLKHSPDMPTLLFGWLEPYAVAGHCLVMSQKGGCFECKANEFGQFQDRVTDFKETTISKEPGGCAHYQHYGPTALMPVASMIATVVIEVLLSTSVESSLNTWISSKEHIDSVKGCLTSQWANEVISDGFSRTYKRVWKKSKSCQLCSWSNS